MGLRLTALLGLVAISIALIVGVSFVLTNTPVLTAETTSFQTPLSDRGKVEFMQTYMDFIAANASARRVTLLLALVGLFATICALAVIAAYVAVAGRLER